jgi:hypothetical protein
MTTNPPPDTTLVEDRTRLSAVRLLTSNPVTVASAVVLAVVPPVSGLPCPRTAPRVGPDRATRESRRRSWKSTTATSTHVGS